MDQKLAHTEVIENFSHFIRENQSNSIDFIIGSSDNKVKFFVEVFPCGIEEKFKDQVSIYFWLATCETTQITAKCRASIVDRCGKQRNLMGDFKNLIF